MAMAILIVYKMASASNQIEVTPNPAVIKNEYFTYIMLSCHNMNTRKTKESCDHYGLIWCIYYDRVTIRILETSKS